MRDVNFLVETIFSGFSALVVEWVVDEVIHRRTTRLAGQLGAVVKE